MIKHNNITIKVQNILGMTLDVITYESCEATVAVGDDWATVYSIQSKEQGKGHAQTLLTDAKDYYEKRNRKFGSSVTLSPAIKHIIDKLGIEEYSDY